MSTTKCISDSASKTGFFRRALSIALTILAVLSLALGAAIALPAGAQEVLPRPEQPFKGNIGRTTKDSTLDFPKIVEAPKGAPNVLLILTDDVGFGATSPFGGPI